MTPITENQMEKEMDNEMETGLWDRLRNGANVRGKDELHFGRKDKSDQLVMANH